MSTFPQRIAKIAESRQRVNELREAQAEAELLKAEGKEAGKNITSKLEAAGLCDLPGLCDPSVPYLQRK